MSLRPDAILAITDRSVEGIIKTLHTLFGKVTALLDVVLLFESAGFTITNAAGGAGTAITVGRVMVDFADAGIDSVRVIVRGNNSAAGSVTFTVHDITANVELCRVTVTGVAAQTAVGAWTAIQPTGADQEIEARCIGNGADDPVAYAIHLQGRTVAART